MTEQDAADQELLAGLDAVTRAIDDAIRLIRAGPPDQRTFEAGTELADILIRAGEKAAGLRAEIVHRIRDAEQLSLRPLAERIGISKSRAQQLLDYRPRDQKEKP